MEILLKIKNHLRANLMPKCHSLFVLCAILSICNSCKFLRYGPIPKQNSYKYSPQRKIENADTVFHFEQPSKNYNLGQAIGLTSRDFNSTNIPLDSFVNAHNTISFLIIRNDTVLYERYTKNYNDTSLVSSFSVVKPMVSTLVGIAINEGKIKSIDDKVTDYIPELKNKLYWDKVTIKYLLHHTSGIKFNLLNNTEFYWGKNLRKKMLNLSFESLPGTSFRYSSENTLLLGIILERVTGNTVSCYLEEKIWKPLGMEAPAFWSLDRADSLAIEKMFCCLQARTIDFAKFARLYLNHGTWNGKQIVSKEWVEYSTRPDPDDGNKHFYNNNWGIGPLKYGSYYAVGIYGQFLYVYPAKNIIIVRFGDTAIDYSPSYWTNIFLQIIDQM